MQTLNPDFLCLQETKCQEDTLPELNLDYPFRYFKYAEKRGYSGTAILTKHEPESVSYGLPGHIGEGRLICLHYKHFALVNVYVPNSKDGLKRLDYRVTGWEPAVRDYLYELAQSIPVIYCGDLNVAHKPIDLANPDTNHRSAGFTDEERDAFQKLLDAGFIDTFRERYPALTDAYSWWSYRTRARERNAGWRIDYFLASNRLKSKIKDAAIHSDIHGSDHCPVSVQMDASLLNL